MGTSVITVIVLTCRLLLTSSVSYRIIMSLFHYIIMSCLFVLGMRIQESSINAR